LVNLIRHAEDYEKTTPKEGMRRYTSSSSSYFFFLSVYREVFFEFSGENNFDQKVNLKCFRVLIIYLYNYLKSFYITVDEGFCIDLDLEKF